jgi:hypothetical protein
MYAHVVICVGALLMAQQLQPRAEKLLAGPLGIAQQASLNQVDLLLELARGLPSELMPQANAAVSAAQRAHETAVRHLIVVERGAVTADYRRWKLRRAISALVRVDREQGRIFSALAAHASPEVAVLLENARRRARLELTRAVHALRNLDGGVLYGGAGVGSTSELSADLRGKGQRGQVSKSQGMMPVNVPSGGRH